MIKFDHKVELLLDFSDELKELKSELLSVETSYQEVTFDKLQARCQKIGKDFFDKFPVKNTPHPCTQNVEEYETIKLFEIILIVVLC